ncbi:MAG: c-type cytochrome [Candidatus Rokubacteria bacterium]|nr:c-type cytochrome [Candidatus Rokubacteria bacterium]
MTRGRVVRILLGGAVGALVVVAAGAAGGPGDASRGRQLFEVKQCARCHRGQGEPGGGPPIERLRRPQGAYELTGRFWSHVPQMFTALTQEGVPWPVISDDEVADLMAYLGADPARDPKPDRLRGHDALVTKGCLKCHSLRGEGARIAPDLGERRAVFAPPARWAATIWRHTPKMAAVAMERGILHPRFSGAEMRHLAAYLGDGPP